MLYGAENWTIGRHQTNELFTTNMGFWQREAMKSGNDQNLGTWNSDKL